MLNAATHIVELSHRLMVPRSDEQLGPGLELAQRSPWIGEDQPFHAPTELVEPFMSI
jgi:hypothetical protein